LQQADPGFYQRHSTNTVFIDADHRVDIADPKIDAGTGDFGRPIDEEAPVWQTPEITL